MKLKAALDPEEELQMIRFCDDWENDEARALYRGAVLVL